MCFYIEQCLHSLFRAVDGIETEVYIVDNHSDDGSVEYLTQKFPDVNIISSNRNLGFSRANNIAIKQCTGEYVLLLNPDTIVGENTTVGCDAVVGNPPDGSDHWGVAVVAADVADGQVIPANAMYSEKQKGAVLGC